MNLSQGGASVIITRGNRDTIRSAQGTPGVPPLGVPYAKTDDLLERAARRMEPKVAAAFRAAVDRIRASLDIGKLTDLFEKGDVKAAMTLLRTSMALPPEQQAALQDALRSMFAATARPAVAEIGYSFNLVNPVAVKFAAERSSSLISGIGENLPEMRAVIARGIKEGIGPRVLARQVEQLVGLLPVQTGMVSRYYAGRVAAGMTPERASVMTARFAAKLLRRRAVTIARHETIHAGVQGRLEAWRQGIKEGFIDPSVTVVIWRTGKDDRVCSICAPLEGATISIEGGSFDTTSNSEAAQAARVKAGAPPVLSEKVRLSQQKMGFARVEGPTAHIMCRCGVSRKSFHTVAETQEVLARGYL